MRLRVQDRQPKSGKLEMLAGERAGATLRFIPLSAFRMSPSRGLRFPIFNLQSTIFDIDGGD
jgi:hypothetical protein